jgi:hypothetical protein
MELWFDHSQLLPEDEDPKAEALTETETGE